MISRILNLFHIFFSYFLKKQERILLLRTKKVSITIYFHKKRHFAASLKEYKIFLRQKFVDSEFVKTFHEQIIDHQLRIFINLQFPSTFLSSQPINAATD